MKDNHIPVPSREQVIHQQLQSLLGVAGVMSQIAGQNWQGEMGTGSLDGGAKMAAEQTLIKTCNRLDTILDLASAWDMRGYDGLITHLNDVYSAHLALLKQQSESVTAMDKPSRRYSPVLVKLPDGRWLAIVGPITDLDNAIIGMGATPEAALTEFDNTFRGIVSKEILDWAAACAAAEEAGQPLPPHPSLKVKNESSKSLEHGRNIPSNSTPRKRKNIPRDGENPGPQRGGNPGET